MKLFYFIPFALLSVACQSKPEPVAIAKPLPPPPPPEAAADYWLSHPSIVLISAEHGLGADTIMDIVRAFNRLYVRKATPNDNDMRDRTLIIRPLYTGEKGEGPSPAASRQFFADQSRLYGIEPKEVGEIIRGVYSRGNQYTPKEDY